MSAKYRLNKRDFLKGLTVSVLTAIFSSLSVFFGNATELNLKNAGTIIITSALSAFFGYLSKNFFTNE